MKPEYTIDDLLRVGAEKSLVEARAVGLERELAKRLTDEQVVQFGSKVMEATLVWAADRATMGPFAPLKPDLNLFALLREFRRLG